MAISTYLQGTPWHIEQMQRTCKDGSKYCLYNKNICTCKASIHYHKKCVGKGDCEDFESKGSCAKSTNIKTYYNKNKSNNLTNDKNKKETLSVENYEVPIIDETEEIIPNERPEEKFKRLTKSRIDKTVNCIRTISNLSNKNLYSYTDEEVDKMFEYLQKAIDKAKKSFKQEEFMEEFKW